jgi:transcriptional regulator with XRE-family HTH domain
MTTKFETTAEAATHLAENPQAGQAVKEEIFWNEMVFALLSMRISKGMTQEQIAECMKCDASKISRLESGNDRQLKWSDIVGYTNALNVQMSIFFDDETLPAAARIKQCVFRIDDDLKQLAQMAQQFDGDAKIAERIASFYQEVLFNFLKRFSENRERLSNFIRIQPKERAAIRDEGGFADHSELSPLPPAERLSSPSQP